ncbi:acetyltransferase (GNAT) family protein [Pontibacter ummariensis]|uniref:Acetyltransferase (GNAT) domain-containing protein n=1 Tax=Pontibacter ummariensis TaxID=1610492 RepID=A0A239F3A1_9BACT|nr:GNAT family N-acetyltransferase [Pontibacter ummariensis]PRY12641.1 acetyltransferase (GNAT) family protein [Pontibacter ummariensis]SNS50652.1 Acetyltransferase (GNAT) domain-containing protein [Pontibacter ummariensis]
MIRIYRQEELGQQLKTSLQHQITEAFGQVPFVQERVWAEPDWVMVKHEQDAVATFYGVVVREVSMDGQSYRIAGISNLITPHAFRGKGYASELLSETRDFLFKELGCVYGLLLCADALLPFYSRLGWYKLEARLYYDQPSGKQLYDSNVLLLAPSTQAAGYPQHIDLNGLPW